MTAIDYDALLASTVRDIGIATIGRKDGLVTHTVEHAQSLVDAIRALRAALAESERDAEQLHKALEDHAAMAAQEKANG